MIDFGSDDSLSRTNVDNCLSRSPCVSILLVPSSPAYAGWGRFTFGVMFAAFLLRVYPFSMCDFGGNVLLARTNVGNCVPIFHCVSSILVMSSSFSMSGFGGNVLLARADVGNCVSISLCVSSILVMPSSPVVKPDELSSSVLALPVFSLSVDNSGD